MTVIDFASRKRIHDMCFKLGNPGWMPHPKDWLWTRPDGQEQGFGRMYDDMPGLCNLLWLTMELGRPPREYDAVKNPVYMLVLMKSGTAKLAGMPLLDAAAMHTLREFHHLLPDEAPQGNLLERSYPMLKWFAAQRLGC